MSDEGQEMADARAYSTWARLEREFALGETAGRARLLLPRHSRGRFIEFLGWMMVGGRRELLPTVLRATSIYTQQTQLVDWGTDESVRAQLEALQRRAGRAESD